MTDEVKLVSNKGFLNSVRNLGLTTVDAVCELIDNSFDARADRISITVTKVGEHIRIIVEDDGDGIPEFIPGENGHMHEGVPYALSFGGRIHHGDVKIGKFGWGLSSAACCQSTRTEVYSKCHGEKSHRYSYIDLNELSREDSLDLPKSAIKNPGEEYQLKLKEVDSGTVVVLKNCDEANPKSENKLVSVLMNEVGEVYRKFISGGKEISVNGKRIEPVDPLMILPSCFGLETLGKGRVYFDETIVPNKDLLDETGKPAEVHLLVSFLDVRTIESTLNDSEKHKHGINLTNQGFYLMRNGRQIGRAQALNLYHKHNRYNYMRGEISFPPVLDRYFGVQTNKSRFSLKEGLQDQLQEKLKTIFDLIPEETRNLIAEVSKAIDKDKPRESEVVFAKALKFLKKKNLSKKEQEIAEAAERDEAKKMEDEVKKIELAQNLSPEEKEVKIREVRNRFQFVRQYKIVLDKIGTGEFYKVLHKGKNNTEVVINIGHPFYTRVYEKATQDPESLALLELLIMTLAHAEGIASNDTEVLNFYKSQRREWSAILATLCDQME